MTALRLSGALLIFVSLILYLRFSGDDARGKQSLAWPTTSGRITQSRLDTDEHRTQGTDYVDVIEYEYTVEGRAYRGRSVDLRVRDSKDRAAMREYVASYPAGKEVTVHYDPANPGDALLVAGAATDTSGPRLLAAGILFPLGLGLIAVSLWRQFSRGRTTR